MNKKVCLAGLLIGIFATPALAAQFYNPHFYLQGDLGYTWPRAESIPGNFQYSQSGYYAVANGSRSQNNFAGGISVGALWDTANPNFAAGLQLGYSWLGSTRYKVNGSVRRSDLSGTFDSEISAKTHGIDILAVGRYKVNDAFSVTGGLGAMYQFNYYDESVHADIVSANYGTRHLYNKQSKRRTGFAPEIQIGGLAKINQQFGVGLTYKHVFGKKFDGQFRNASSTLGSHSLLLNLVYTFA